jgi:hypothetical protein
MSSPSSHPSTVAFERVCYSFFSSGNTASGKVVGWFVGARSGDKEEGMLSCGLEGAEDEELAIAELGSEFVARVKADEVFYGVCIEVKNQARTRAHLAKGAERQFVLREVCMSSHQVLGIDEEIGNRDIPKVKHLLQELILEFQKDNSLIIIIRGIAAFLEAQRAQNVCLTVGIAADSLAERSDSVKQALANFFSSIAAYVPTKDETSPLLMWRTKTTVSNRTLASISRSVKEAITSQGLDSTVGKNDASTISFLDDADLAGGRPPRTNLDGTQDVEPPGPCSQLSFLPLACCFSPSSS